MHVLSHVDLRWSTSNGVAMAHVPDLGAGRVLFAIFTRLGGVSEAPFHWLNMSYSVGDDPAAVAANRGLAISAVGARPSQVCFVALQHGNLATIVTYPRPLPPADAVATAAPGLIFAMTFADCLPIFFVDERVPAVALAHAGWRGSVGRVAVAAWRAMQSLGATAQTTRVYLGPGIRGCCYPVGAEVAEAVVEMGLSDGSCLLTRNGQAYLDLAVLNGLLLEEQGLNVLDTAICTACRRDIFFSHRAEGGRTGRFCIFAGIL